MTDTPMPVSPQEVAAAVNDLGEAFAEFKSSVVESSRDADRLAEEKTNKLSAEIGRLNRRLDELKASGARPPIATDRAFTTSQSQGYERFLRKGILNEETALEIKAFSGASDADGGYAIPEELDASVEMNLRDVSPLRAHARVVQIGSSAFKKVVATEGIGAGWVGEADPRAETTTPPFAEVVPPLGELYANPAVSQAMLDDAVFDVEQWLVDELAQEFGKLEGSAFVAGTGVNMPKGFATYATSAANDAARPFGTLGHVATGSAGDFPSSDPADTLIDLVHALRPAFRSRARFVMNSDTLNTVRKFKDSDGQFLWRPGLSDGESQTLLGYPVLEIEDMPGIASGSLSIAFGDFFRGYTITDRQGTRVLRDPYSNKPFVHFYSTRRTGGAVVDSQAIKFLKFSAS